MPRPKQEFPPRCHTTLRLSEENNDWLDEVKAATGKSRSDLVNDAIAALRDEARIKQLVKEALIEERADRESTTTKGQDA